VPNDPSYRDLQWNLSLLGMPAVWDINPGGSASVIVAVVDTGLTSAPASLTRRLWTGQGFEMVTLPFDVHPDLARERILAPQDLAFERGDLVLDFDGHGTHVASIIAEESNNDESLAGMAYRTRLMPVKVCVGFWELMLQLGTDGVPGYLPADAGGCASEDIAAGIRYAADNGAHVINLSLGGSEPAPAEREAIVYAIQRGAFVATSMGNDYEQGNTPEFPAVYASSIDGLMSVGAIGKSRTRAYYSATGSHLEIVAPGGDSRDGGGEDRGFIWQVTLLPPDQDVFESPRPRFDRYVEVGYSGTSMAAAHVSATAALLVSQGVTNPRAIEAILRATAADLGSTGRDNEFGFGLVQPRLALFGMGIR
jgi:serine protease